MKAFITGADGLLGSNLVRVLLAAGHSVRVLIQPGSRSRSLEGLPLERREGDLLDRGDGLASAMSACEAVFHCAAITDQWAPAEIVWKVNEGGTRNVLEAGVKAGVKKLVAVGSASSFQFGPRERPGDESAPFPESYRGIAYMESKHRAAELVKEFAAERGVPACVVAPTFLIGPYDSRPSSGELIRQFIQRRLKFTSPGGRNFVHAGDAAAAMLSAYESGRSGETYILGGENLSYLEFFGKVARAAGLPAPKFVVPEPLILMAGCAGSAYERVSGRRALLNLTLAKLSVLGTYYSAAKAKKELGLAQSGIDQAIELAIASLREYGHL